MINEAHHQAIVAIKTAESRLREILSNSAGEGRYSEIPRIAELAEGLARLTRGQETEYELPEEKLLNQKTAASENVGSTVQSTAIPQEEKHTRTAIERHDRGYSALSKTRRKALDTYPKFFNDGSFLVKVGWSKTGKCEYEHKANHEIVTILVDALEREARRTVPILTDSLFPLETSSREEIPSYQAYLCLAWLKAVGIVEQIGRRGYRIPSPENFRESVESAWSRLESKSH